MEIEYIEKQKAVKAVRFYSLHSGYKLLYADEALKAIPPADVRPMVRSHWKKNDNETYSCERCHSWIPEEQRHYANWCLYCGADMRGGDAEWELMSSTSRE